MKHVSSMMSVFFLLTVLPAITLAQSENGNSLFTLKIVKSGCCKERASSQHPWRKTNKNYQQCEQANKTDGDRVSKSQGKLWWDRSC